MDYTYIINTDFGKSRHLIIEDRYVAKLLQDISLGEFKVSYVGCGIFEARKGNWFNGKTIQFHLVDGDISLTRSFLIGTEKEAVEHALCIQLTKYLEAQRIRRKAEFFYNYY